MYTTNNTRNVHFCFRAWVIFTMGYCDFVNISRLIMHISAMLRAFKVIEEVMKLLNDIEVHTYVFYLINYVYNDCAGILEYPLSSPLVDWLLVYVVSTRSMPRSLLPV